MLTPGVGQGKKQREEDTLRIEIQAGFLNCLPQYGRKGKAYAISSWPAWETEP